MDTFEQLENTLTRLLQWVDSADAKTAPVFAIITAMLGAIVALAPDYQFLTASLFWHGALTVGLLLIAIGALICVTFPRTNGPGDSLIYFGGIASRSRDEFVDSVSKWDGERYRIDLSIQCYINSKIARVKFQALRISMGFLFLSVIPWLILIWRLYQVSK